MLVSHYFRGELLPKWTTASSTRKALNDFAEIVGQQPQPRRPHLTSAPSEVRYAARNFALSALRLIVYRDPTGCFAFSAVHPRSNHLHPRRHDFTHLQHRPPHLAGNSGWHVDGGDLPLRLDLSFSERSLPLFRHFQW